MDFKLINQNLSDDRLLIILICIAIVFFVLILPKLEKQSMAEYNSVYENFNNITKDLPMIDQHICSAQCCKFVQWPIPFNNEPLGSKENLSNYIGSNMTCNNGQSGGGCVCIQKNDYDYLANHGQTDSNPTDNPILNF
uniref:Uncharacterized protein n=1 Tax=viral metagenome TaxID=1070528 RepID=A0A6C0D9I1_9ZZZZ